MLFLHYFGGSSLSWDPLRAALGGAARDAAPDARGFGDAPATGGLAVADYADDAAAVAAGLGPFVLVGHSMGGKVAVVLAARRPAGLRGMVLVAPSPPGPEPMSDEARAGLRASFGDPAAARNVARAISVHRDDAVFDRIVADHMRAKRAAWDAWLDNGSREDISAAAARVAVPVLVVAGAEDAALGPAAQARVTLPLFPGAGMATVAGSRHLVPQDAPEALAGHVERFVSGLPGRSCQGQGWSADASGLSR